MDNTQRLHLKPCLDRHSTIYALRKRNHEKETESIHGGTREELTLYHGAKSPKLTLTITPHKRKNPRHDVHIMWRDGDGSCVDAGAFNISGGVNDLELDKHFAHLTESETTESKALQLAWQLYGASRTFIPLPWLVAKGQGGDDNQGRKIPSYGVSVGIEAITAKYVKDTEERLLDIVDEAAVPVYKDALQELRGTLYKWLDRLNSDASQDDLWNNPSRADLLAAIEAIGIQLEDIKKSR